MVVVLALRGPLLLGQLLLRVTEQAIDLLRQSLPVHLVASANDDLRVTQFVDGTSEVLLRQHFASTLQLLGHERARAVFGDALLF